MAMKGNEIWILLAIVVGVMYVGGMFDNFGGQSSQPIADQNPDDYSSQEKACVKTTMNVDFAEKYNEGTDVSSQNATVYVNGQKLGVYSEGSTFSVTGGDKLDVYYGLDPAQTTYYASHASGNVPCTGGEAAFTTSDSFMKSGSMAGAMQNPPNKLYRSSTAASTSVYNKKTLASNPGTAISIGAGAKETARIYISWDYEEGYGVVDGNTLACRFTDSQIDQSELVATLDGQMLGSAKYIPSATKFGLSAANQSTKYWAFPPIDAGKVSESVLDLQIKGDDTDQPVANTNMSCEIIDTDLYELDSGGVAIGVEDSDDNSDVGRSTEVLFNLALS